MYAFVDRPVTSLDRGSRFLIWSMRSWSLAVRQKHCPGPLLAPAFAKWRMIGALQPFLRLMIAFERDSLMPVSFCSLRCLRIAEHEAIMLAVFVAMTSGDRLSVRDTLAGLVSEELVGDALGSVEAIASALAKAELVPAAPDAMRS
ncbi:MAG: hypothetical protein KDE32_08570 [Novosphingobium sp.]|nr:hypothetical protein [Novosphingobium sp.]